jgi:hypothetical protein
MAAVLIAIATALTPSRAHSLSFQQTPARERAANDGAKADPKEDPKKDSKKDSKDNPTTNPTHYRVPKKVTMVVPPPNGAPPAGDVVLAPPASSTSASPPASVIGGGLPQQRSTPQDPARPGPGRAPSSSASAPQSTKTSRADGTLEVTERALTKAIGPEAVKQYLDHVRDVINADGMGAPTAHAFFDQARLRLGHDTTSVPLGTRASRQGTAPNDGCLKITGGCTAPTIEQARKAARDFGGIPQGVVLQGVASGIGPINELRYDARFNAFIINNRFAYFMAVPPRTLALLCRAIAQDGEERIGVSLGTVDHVFGLAADADIAWDLKLIDRFLGDIVFAESDWSHGYSLAPQNSPQLEAGYGRGVCVFFQFNRFEFEAVEEIIRCTSANLDITLMPLVESASDNGLSQPDEAAISVGHDFPRYEANARHIGSNIDHYRRERLMRYVFAYGEAAAFFRAVKKAKFDLMDLSFNLPGGLSK